MPLLPVTEGNRKVWMILAPALFLAIAVVLVAIFAPDQLILVSAILGGSNAVGGAIGITGNVKEHGHKASVEIERERAKAANATLPPS